jgi:hypothetical protein
MSDGTALEHSLRVHSCSSISAEETRACLVPYPNQTQGLLKMGSDFPATYRTFIVPESIRERLHAEPASSVNDGRVYLASVLTRPCCTVQVSNTTSDSVARTYIVSVSRIWWQLLLSVREQMLIHGGGRRRLVIYIIRSALRNGESCI